MDRHGVAATGMDLGPEGGPTAGIPLPSMPSPEGPIGPLCAGDRTVQAVQAGDGTSIQEHFSNRKGMAGAPAAAVTRRGRMVLRSKRLLKRYWNSAR